MVWIDDVCDKKDSNFLIYFGGLLLCVIAIDWPWAKIYLWDLRYALLLEYATAVGKFLWSHPVPNMFGFWIW
jgi:hypothetical protein